MSAPIAYGWTGRYRACRDCGTTRRPEIDDGLCGDCAALRYGALGLADVPPRWAREERPMALERPRLVALPDPDPAPEAWHPSYPDGCVRCGRTIVPHQARGLCRTCYRSQYLHQPNSPERATAERTEQAATIAVPPPSPTLDAPPPAPPLTPPVPAALVAPTLRARHAERVTIHRFTCPNCGGRLGDPATGRDEFRAIDGDLTLSCGAPPDGAGCGARWAITAETLAGAA